MFYPIRFMTLLRGSEGNQAGEERWQWWVHHHAALHPLVPTSPLQSSDYCSLKNCADHRVCQATPPTREANIPDRVHYACDVNEVCAPHTSAVCHHRARRQGEGCKCFHSLHFVHKQQKKKKLKKITCSSQLTLIGTNFHLKNIWRRASYLLLFH